MKINLAKILSFVLALLCVIAFAACDSDGENEIPNEKPGIENPDEGEAPDNGEGETPDNGENENPDNGEGDSGEGENPGGSDEQEPHRHSFTNYVSNGNATCTADGTKTAKCDGCDETDTVADTGTATGHNILAPTCTEASVCVWCGAVFAPAADHIYYEGACTICGSEQAVLTITQALAASDDTYVLVVGSVIEINTPYNSGYDNISVTIADESGNTLYLYRLNGNVAVHDIIIVEGSMGTYIGKRQISRGSCKVTGTEICTEFTAANCAEASKCVLCGKENGVPLPHTEVIDKSKAPTCTETGISEGSHCSVCNKVLIEQTIIDAKGHNEVVDAAVAASCTKTGLSEGKHCTVCGTVTVVQVKTPVIAHAYDDKYDENCNVCGFVRDAECAHRETVIISGTPATCTKAGLTDGEQCKKCGHILVAQKSISPLSHTEVIDKKVDATCTSTGLTEGKHCSVCGEIIVSQSIIKALGHRYTTDAAVNATCTESGLTEGKHCSVCYYVLTEQELINALGHDLLHYDAKSPTCLKKGWNAYDECSRCAYSTYIEIESLGHDLTYYEAKEPTCTDVGWNAYQECLRCDYSTYSEIESLNHNLTYHVSKEPTCTEVGWNDYEECSRCDYTTYIEIKELGHSVVIDAAVDPTCTSTGLTEGKRCSVCGEVLKAQTVVDMLDHELIHHEEKAPTCAEVGWHAYYVCANCDYTTYTDSTIIEKIDHNLVHHDAKTPTCTESGWDAYSDCTNCDYTTYVYLAPLGHTYDNAYDESCNCCGEIRELTFSQDLKYVLLEDNTYAMVGIGGYEGFNIVVPPEYKDKPVTRIVCSIYNFYSLSIPDSVTYVSISGSGSMLVGSITVDENNQYYKSIDGNLYTKDGTTLVRYTRKAEETSFIIPDGVTHIGGHAFYGTLSSLKSITIPDSVISIGAEAFRDCTALEEVHISDVAVWCNIDFDDYYSNPLYYAKNLYLRNSLIENLVIPEGVTEIPDGAFCNLSSIKSITIPNTVTSIGIKAFEYCTSIRYITIPDSVTSIGVNAFSYCEGVLEVIIGSGLTSIAKSTFYGCKLIRSVTLSEGLTDIGEYAFYGCAKLKKVELPDSVVSIDKAFTGCTSLTSITIGVSTASIDVLAFEDCTSLSSIDVDENNTVYKSINGDLYSKDGKTLIRYAIGKARITDIVGDGVTSIGEYAYDDAVLLTKIYISDSVTSIGKDAFRGCTALTYNEYDNALYLGNDDNPYLWLIEVKDKSITACSIHSDTKFIQSEAFWNCTNLTNIIIPENVISIGYSAFSGCTMLTSVTFEENSRLESIGAYAFSGCSGLTSVIIPDSVTSIGSSLFNGCTALESLTIPFVGATKDGTGYTSFGYIFKTYNYDYSNSYVPASLKTVVITSGTNIAESAFSGCTGLEFIVISGSVTDIGKSAFKGCTALMSIIIPNSLISIGDDAFNGCTSLVYNEYDNALYLGNDDNLYLLLVEVADKTITSCTVYNKAKVIYTNAFSGCTELTSVVIGDELVSIGDSAFNGCTKLTDIIIPQSMTSIGSSAFKGCTSLASITIPDKVTSICSGAFSGCTGLTSVTFGENSQLESVGSSAFRDCAKITSIVIPDSVVSIGFAALSGCTSLESLTIPFVGTTKDGAENTYIGYIFGQDRLWRDNNVPASLKTVVVTGGTTIAESAFSGCTGLTSIVIPDSVTSIGDSAFGGCTGLTSIVIPDSVTSIGDSAFKYCTALKEVHISDISAWCNIDFGGSSSNPLYYAKNLYLNGSLITELKIPEGVTEIPDYAFYYQSSITSLTIPSSVTSIGKYAFYKCTGLTSVTFAENSKLESLGDYAFYGCTGLTSVTFAENSKLESLGDYAFYGCTELTSIMIPDSVINIGYRALSECTGLTSITILASITSIGSDSFYGCTGLESITIPDSVTSIGSCAFYDCIELKSIVIPDSVTSIGYNAFSGCTGLKSITIPFVGEKKDGTGDTDFRYLFGNSTVPALLKTVIITGGEIIGNYAFNSCTGLESITIPDSVISIGDYAFSDCTNLKYNEYDNAYYLGNENNPYLVLIKAKDYDITSCEINSNTKFIQSYAFYYCTELTSITIPDSVTSIGSNAFSYCTELTSITIPDSITSISSHAFYNCTNLQYNEYDNAYYLGNENNPYVVLIKAKDTSITSCEINANTKIVYYSAFYDCIELKSIVIPDSVTSIGYNAFSGCTGLTIVTIGSGVTSIGERAFRDCISLESIIVSSGNTVYHSEGNCLIETESKTLVLGCKNSIIPTDGSVTSIGSSAFYGCTGLTSITIPNSVISIGSSAFYGCTGLTSITIPDSVTSIGTSAFSGCTGLESVTFENTSGWFVSTSSTATSGTSIDVTDSAVNATNLNSTYVYYYWKRRE